MSLSDNLALLRARRQLTQRQLAAKSGVGVATVNRIEGGDYVPNLLTLDKLARALGVSLEALATPEELREARRARNTRLLRHIIAAWCENEGKTREDAARLLGIQTATLVL